MKRMTSFLLSLAVAGVFVSCQQQGRPVSLDAALNSITAADLAAHVQKLASDEFEGRGPASRGEELTINFLADEFKKLGLKPGNTDGTYFQKVPLVGITPEPAPLTLSAGAKKTQLKFADDFVAWTKRVAEMSSIDADLVFVGYGATAPEFNWDDFKGEDVKGKVIVMLINDPPVPDPNDPSKLDDKVFGGKAMTYYGRWTYKFETAAEQGAAGALLIHETDRAGYPWDVVRNSWSAEQFDLVRPDKNMSRCAIEGWLTVDKAKALFQMAGKDFESLKKSAATRDFRPVPLGVKASLSITNKIRTIDSNNVIARLDGSDPQLKSESVVYMAHWDHFGIGPEVQGQKIYHGALDNASGTAGLLEIAQAYTKLSPPPRRTLLFLSVTAEEQGLLGSKYYAENPIYPLEKTLAALNMDGLNIYGKTKDITIIGLGNSTLDDLVKEVAMEQGRTVRPDAEPEKGFFYRSDHFSFAKQGVPALHPDSGTDYIGRPSGWGLEMRAKYNKERYHKPQDVYDPSWDLSGAIEDLQLLFKVGHHVAEGEKWPEWNPGTEFKAKREQMLKKQ
jgi:Zn-dependent M28 family amino/carboxypeptidase